MDTHLHRHLETTSEPNALWCGVEVELYWICLPRGGRDLYVRAHATRLTMIREQKNWGQRFRASEENKAREVLTTKVEEFTVWEQARRSDLVQAAKPWTPREIRILTKLGSRQPFQPVMCWIELLALAMSVERGNLLYGIGDKLCRLGKPEGLMI